MSERIIIDSMQELANFVVEHRDKYCNAAIQWEAKYGSPHNQNQQAQKYQGHYSSMQEAMNTVLQEMHSITGIDFD